MNKVKEIFNRLKNTNNKKVLIGIVCGVVLINILLICFLLKGNNKVESNSSRGVSSKKEYRVNGNSMSPTIDDGTVVYIEKRKEVMRYDIVVYDYDGNNTLIKRVYGLPNEKITINEGVIYINDEPIEDEYSFGNTSGSYEVTLGDDEYFVLGDYRDISLDSRHLGPIKKSSIKGVVVD